jgi:ethanolamine utilization protein EutQ (cupin superfamily)
MPSMLKVAEYFKKSQWVQDTLESMITTGNIDEGLEMNNVERIMKTNRGSYMALAEAMGKGSIGSVSFWVTRKAVDMDFNTVSKMVARKEL